ncbi:MAG: hypothetical protein OXK80_01055 [Bdellovibrionales bacterium]|nr:hypothetical protein [Bdellovibrionales bacterium]
MKLLVVLLLTVAGLQAVAVDADFSGEYRFRASSESSAGGDVVDNLGTNLSSDIRAKVSGSFRPSESFEGVAGLYLDLDDYSALSDRMVAYGDWMISDEFMLRAGQSTYKIADGSVIGINDYDAVPTLFKGLFLTHSSENVGLDVALVQNKDVSDLFIVSVDARSFPDLVKTANFHLIVKDVRGQMGIEKPLSPLAAAQQALMASEAPAVDGAVADDSGSEGVYLGATLGGGAGGFGYKVTASTDSLTNILSLSSLLINGKVSYSFEMDNSTLKAFIGGHMDGSDYDALLYERHYNAGKMDLVQWGRGLTYVYGGLAYKTSADWKLGVKGYHFLDSNADMRPDVTQVSDGDTEVDVYVKKNFNSSVSGKVWAGVLVPKAGDTGVKAQAVVQMKF